MHRLIFKSGGCAIYIYMPYWPSLRSRWLDIGQVLLRAFFDRDQVEVNKNAKKNEATIKPFWPKKLGQWRIYYISKKINFSQKRARWAHLKLPFRTQVPTREFSHIIKGNIVGLGVASGSFNCLSLESLLITQSCNFLFFFFFHALADSNNSDLHFVNRLIASRETRRRRSFWLL